MNYLYNGAEFPDINTVYTPELQEIYPCACITKGSTYTSLYLTNGRPYVNDRGYYQLTRATYVWYGYTENPETAESIGHNTHEWCYRGTTELGGSTPSMSGGKVLWTNTDLYTGFTGGTLYLAASDPIPVGIAPQIDPFSMTMGWLAGNRIAGQTGK